MARCIQNEFARQRRLALRVGAAFLAACALGGCSLGYYWQAMQGHMELMGQRQPVDEVLADPETPLATRAQLQLAQAALDFAHRELALPDNGSYRQYAATGRRYLVWNVVAAPAWSLEPRTWCFPVAGCVSYRGYFDEARARAFAARRAAAGDDVFVGGVTAYSTLGRFADPLTDVMLASPDHRVAGLIFHELAHQQVYLAGDTAFNESFASAVEQAGIRRWLRARGDSPGLCAYERWLERRAAVRAVLGRGRASLGVVYAQDGPGDGRRAAKADALDAMRADYRRLRDEWPQPPYFDAWFGPALNNASLAALSAYDQYVPAFARLLETHGADFAAFYSAVEVLGRRSAAEREERLQALQRAAVSSPPPPAACPPQLAAGPGSPPG
jgi:predicted aminopeptidase